MADDIELVRQVSRGDPEALRTLVAAHGAYLHGVAHALTGSPADAEDLVQETLVAAMKGGFRGDATLRTWLVQILVRRAAMLRRWYRRKGGAASLEAAPPGLLPAAPSGDGPASADARLDLATMLHGLSMEHRTVLVLRELQGMTYDEIAAALRVPRGTVESRLFRAREELRRRYRDYLRE